MAKKKRRAAASVAEPRASEQAEESPPEQMGRKWAVGVGAYLLGLTGLCVSWLVSIWGSLQPLTEGENAAAALTDGFASGWPVEERLFVAAILAGTLGSLLHTIQSFTKYLAYQRLYRAWFAWYLMRPFIGAMLASMIFLIVRGGFLTTGQDAVSLNGLIALAGVGGMFSEPATQRLSEIANAVFGTTRDSKDALAKKDKASGK